MIRLAGTQFNRVSRAQLRELGMTDRAIAHRVAAGRLVITEEGVFAVAPVLENDIWGRFIGATLTAPDSLLTHASAAAAWGLWSQPREFETITRPGSGGPCRYGGVLAFRSLTLDGDRTKLHGIAISTVPRTLLDLAAHVDRATLARVLRDAVRVRLTTIEVVFDRLGESPGRRGSRRLALAAARYTDLPIAGARSGAEVRALEVLRDAGRPPPRLNVHIAGEEADLSWARLRLIIEIDGGPFHLDIGEDARKQAIWEGAGWTVLRLPSDTVHEQPERLLALAPTAASRRPSLSGPQRG